MTNTWQTQHAVDPRGEVALAGLVQDKANTYTFKPNFFFFPSINISFGIWSLTRDRFC